MFFTGGPYLFLYLQRLFIWAACRLCNDEPVIVLAMECVSRSALDEAAEDLFVCLFEMVEMVCRME